MKKQGFDNDKYLKEQKAFILDRMSKVEGKLYIECGGKLLFDYHAARVLPGFDTNDKMKVFQSFKDDLDVIICIHAGAAKGYGNVSSVRGKKRAIGWILQLLRVSVWCLPDLDILDIENS